MEKEEEKAASLEAPKPKDPNPSVAEIEMARNSVSWDPAKPSWFTPKRYFFALFTVFL